jgi:hypothetical protein
VRHSTKTRTRGAAPHVRRIKPILADHHADEHRMTNTDDGRARLYEAAWLNAKLLQELRALLRINRQSRKIIAETIPSVPDEEERAWIMLAALFDATEVNTNGLQRIF